jgi:peptidyl-tRNA hydrolase
MMAVFTFSIIEYFIVSIGANRITHAYSSCLALSHTEVKSMARGRKKISVRVEEQDTLSSVFTKFSP